MMPSARNSDAARWSAVVARSDSQEGPFFYAVRTTGIFCRPTCASRRPRRENVEFFETASAATRAGYRACKRCNPEDASATEPMASTMIEACGLLASEDAITTGDVARAVGWSDSYFHRQFKKRFGVTPQQYRRRVFAERGRAALVRGRSVTESIYAAGYSSSSRFYEGVGQELGMKPAAARAGGMGERIEFAVARCSLGHILIARTARGVCEVAFADSPEALLPQLASHFPKAILEASADPSWAEAVIDSVDMATPAAIPIDIRGTAFRERVWQALRSIPAGQTRTYSEVASALGEPTAARAVARACATNPLAVLVPCHRVVRKDGNLAGYRWGIERKRALLGREAAIAEKPGATAPPATRRRRRG